MSGSGVAIAEASDIKKVWAHLGPWIKGYGIEFDVTAVVSDAQFAAMGLVLKRLQQLNKTYN